MSDEQPKTCADCQYWSRLADALDEGHESPARDEFALWGRCGRQDEPDTPIYSQDASDYLSWITTREGFSCIEWSAR